MKNALIVFAREPVPGRVKTRLAAVVGDIAAAEAYASMLENVLRNCRKLSDVETTVFWDCDEASLPLLESRYGCRSKMQSGGDLGQRLQAAFAETLGTGCDHCCIIGSDSPDLPRAYIQEAFNLLATSQTEAVFGPTHDGGYYLLGLSRLWPQLFENIGWSTPQTLRQSLAAAEQAGIRAALLPKWHDIDTLDDLNEYRARTRAKSGMLRVNEEL